MVPYKYVQAGKNDEWSRITNDEISQAFQDLVVRPKSRGGNTTEGNWKRQWSPKHEKPLERVYPEFDVLSIIRGLYQTMNPNSFAVESKINKAVAKELKRQVDNNSFISTYQSNPRLMDTGSLDDYYQYTQSIFPDSKVNEMYFHGGPSGIEKLKSAAEIGHTNPGINSATRDYGIYVTPKKWLANIYAATSTKMKGSPHIYPVKLNVKSPYRYEHPSWYFDKLMGGQDLRFSPSSISKKWYDKLSLKNNDAVLNTKSKNAWDDGEIAMFNGDDIHILGSESDVRGFQNWKKNPIYTNKPLDDLSAIYNNPVQYDHTVKNYLKASVPGIILGSISAAPFGGLGYLLYNHYKNDKK